MMAFNNHESIKTIFGSTLTGFATKDIIIFWVIFIQFDMVTHSFLNQSDIIALGGIHKLYRVRSR